MSDLFYYTTAVTKGKKPRVVFLSEETWIFNPEDADLETLKNAKELSRFEPTHCLFVEAHDGLRSALYNIVEEKGHVNAEEFYKLIKDLDCKTVSTRKKKKAKEKVRFDDISTIDLLGTKSTPTSKIVTSKENSEINYAICTETADGQITYYCSDNPKHFINRKKQQIELFTQSDAIKLQKDIDDGAIWNVFKFSDIDYFEGYADGLQQTKEESTSDSKKRVVYTLYCDRGYYANYDKMQIRIDGTLIDAYRTRQDAQFAADIRNLNSDTSFGWKIEKREIAF